MSNFVSRYGHAAHVIGGRLVVVGGVWLHSEGVPGVAVIDLTSGSSVEFPLDTVMQYTSYLLLMLSGVTYYPTVISGSRLSIGVESHLEVLKYEMFLAGFV